MNNQFLEPLFLKTTLLDLLSHGKRELLNELIDYYYTRCQELIQFEVLGEVSLKANKRDTYLKCAEACYILSNTPEQLYNSRINLYNAYSKMNYPEKALFYIDQNLKINPNSVDDLILKVANLSLAGQKDLSYNLLLEIDDKFSIGEDIKRPLLSSKLLKEGKTSIGLHSFLNTHQYKFLENINVRPKIWNGIIQPGKILYVYASGGIGDQIINIKFFDRIKSYGMRPILFSDNTEFYGDINNVFRRHNYEVCDDINLLLYDQYWIEMMSLPAYLNLSEDQLWTGTYLTPLRNQKNNLDSKKFKIGIKCSGNPYFDQDEYRKIPIEQIVEILPSTSEIYYIDKNKINYSNVIDLSSRITSWDDTLDFIDQMNCIVSSCTSLVHAAAAIGKQTFVAVPIAEYYIWSTSKTDGTSPWHGDNLFVARQTKLRSWKEPLEEIKIKLNTYIENELKGS